MPSAQRYIPEFADGMGDPVRLPAEPTYRHAVEELERQVRHMSSAATVKTRILLDIGEVDLTSRDVLLGLMPYDPLIRTVFEFARTQGMAGIAEVSGGPDAGEAWRADQAQVPLAVEGRVNGHAPLQLATGSRRATALADFLPLLQLALQALLVNADPDGMMTEAGKDVLEGQVFAQARGMLAALGVTDVEMDHAGLIPEGAGRS